MSEENPAKQKQRAALEELFGNFGIKVDDWREVRIRHELENKKMMYFTISRLNRAEKEQDKSR